MVKEKSVINDILLKHHSFGRLFRNNTGLGWVGKVFKKGQDVFIKNARPLRAGLCKGSSDIIGFTCVNISQEMVGKNVAIFTAIEVKTSGKKTKEQKAFLEMVRKLGGIGESVKTTTEYETKVLQ